MPISSTHPALDEFRSRLRRGAYTFGSTGANKLRATDTRTGTDDGHRQAQRHDRAQTSGAPDRRNDRRPGRLQRQPERLDFIDARSTSSASSASTGTTRPSSTTRPRSSAASTRPCAARPSSWSIRSAACAAQRSIDQNLQDARGAVALDEETWYFGLRPFGPRRRAPSFYRDGILKLRAFNDRLLSNARSYSMRAPTICASSSTASPATSARPRTS